MQKIEALIIDFSVKNNLLILLNYRILFILSLLLFVSCRKHNDPQPLPERTVIVYMVADNSLDSFVEADLNEMEFGWNDKYNGNLIVYVDRTRKTPYVLEIKYDRTESIVSPEVIKYNEQNSCSLTVMEKVLSDIKQRYPAKSYGLVLWSHADGWLPASVPQTRAFGEDGNDQMEITDLGKLSGKYDFIMFDACDMSAIEVVYELKNCTDYVLASAAKILAGGFPYDRIIKYLFEPKANLVYAAQIFMAYYRDFSDQIYQTAAMTITETGKLNELAAATRPLIQKYKNNIPHLDLSDIQQYNDQSIFFDFKDFLEHLASDGELQEFNKALSAAVIFEDHTPKILNELEIKRSCGLTCHIPGRYTVDYSYQNLAWYKYVYR